MVDYRGIADRSWPILGPVMRGHARRIQVRAREVTDDERRTIWPRAIEHNPHWGRCQRRTDRRIPVVILRPVP